MNKALFYSLMESSCRLRDYSMLLEADDPEETARKSRYAEDTKGVTPEMLAKSAKKRAQRQEGGVSGVFRKGEIKLRKGMRDVSKFVNKHGEDIGAKAGEMGSRLAKHGTVRTLAKAGAVGIPAFIAGSLHGMNKTRQFVDDMPAVKAAKEWGPWIEKAKKYGPYAGAAGVGLLAAHALSNNNN